MKKMLIVLSVVLAIGAVVAGLYIHSDYSFSFIETYKKNFSENILSLKIKYEMRKAEKEEEKKQEELMAETMPEESTPQETPTEEVVFQEELESEPEAEPVKIYYTDLEKKFIQTGEPIALDTASSARFENYLDGMLCVVENSIVMYNKNGKVLWSVPIRISNPILKVEGEYILLMEQNGKKIALYNGKRQQFMVETKENILTGNLSKNGDCAIITEKAYYKGAVEVYNKSGLEIYSRSFGKNSAISVAISDARRLCVSLLSMEGGVSSQIVFLDLDKTEEDVIVNYDDCIIFNLDFNGTKLLATADNQLLALNSNGRQLWRRDYSSKTLNGYCDDESTRLMLFDANNGAELSIVNSSGKEKQKITEDIVPDFCDISDNYVLYNGGRSLYLTKSNGTPLAKYVATRDMKKAYFINSDNILVVYNQSIEFLRVEKGE